MKSTTVRIMVAVLVLALVLGGFGLALIGLVSGSDSSPRSEATPPAFPAPTSSPDEQTTVAPDPALAEFYEQELAWERCGDAFECATLTVPLDYTDPDAGELGLALLKDPADDPEDRIGSLVVNPGGPGASGTGYAEQASSAFRKPILSAFDIVGFDPRGTGASSPVDCLTDAQLDAFIATDPDPDSAIEARQYADLSAALGDGCRERSGELVAHVSTVEAARDIDVLRAALGEPELHFFGASYGTKLGATYAELYPDRVGRMVLDGGIDLRLDFRERALGQAAGFETALRAYVTNCVEETDSCFLGSSVEDGLERIQQFFDEVDSAPLPTSTDRQLDAGNAFYGILLPLYVRDYWILLSQALQAAFEGDGTTLLQLSDFYTSREADGSYSDNSAEAIYAINCLDDPSFVPIDEVDGEFTAFDEASPTFGRVFAWGLNTCSGLPTRAAEPIDEVDAAGAPPIVVVGTTRDPATPYEWSEGLAEQLESGVLVTRDGDGHTGYNAGNACIDAAVEAYLVNDVVPEDGLTC